jgi:biotin transport system substrate-specific component
MEINLSLDKFYTARYSLFRWRFELGLVQKVLLALSFACITGILAQVRVMLPWSPVPITGQTCAVLLSAVVLGKWWGGISQGLYLGIGLAGLPWFTGFNSGLGYLTGATGGYLIGFVLAAFFLGYLVDTRVQNRKALPLVASMLTANFAIIYGCGLLHLYVWMTVVQGATVDVLGLLMMGAVPFILGDLLKVGLASGISLGITPKQSYGAETA